jgi:hypothetical protein
MEGHIKTISNLDYLIGKEFYLGRTNFNAIRYLKQTESFKNRFQNVVKRMFDPKQQNIGSITEIILRQPGQLRGYVWQTADLVTYADGSHLEQEQLFELFKSSIFTPNSINTQDGFSMIGEVRSFNRERNILGSTLKKPIVIYYNQIPAHKTCLGIIYGAK